MAVIATQEKTRGIYTGDDPFSGGDMKERGKKIG